MRGAAIRHALVVLSLALALVATAQPAPADASVFSNDVRWPIRADGYAIVPVCIVEGSSAAEKDGILIHDPNPALSIVVGQVRNALRTSWEGHSSVRFVGWEDCTSLSPSEQEGAIGLYINPDADNRSHLGIRARGRTSAADPATSFKPWGNSTQCIDYNFGRARMEYRFSCAEQYGIHEFGHAIGFDHEWFNPATPSTCSEERDPPKSANEVSTTFGVKPYTVVNPLEFDWDSIMTYISECAHVTGERFGSTNLSSWDQVGAAEVYPPVPQRPNDVGVIPAVAGSCPDPTEVKIYQDNDDDNNNERGGWIGSIVSNRNTTFEFCKVDGTRFGRLAPTQAGNDYAVLKLGDSCPAGSSEFVRYHDDADTPPVNESWMAGETGPTRQNFDGGDGTELHWCLFRQSLGPPGMFRFPDLGFDYGVLAAPTLSEAAETGFVFTDDEDTANQNRLMNRFLSPLDESTKTVVDTLMETGANTRFLLARVNTNEPPTVSASVLTPDPVEDERVFLRASGEDPNGDAISYSWEFPDGALASGPTVSHVFDQAGSYQVKVTAMDSSGLTGSTTLTVPVANVPPSVSATGAAIDENGVATISVTIDDPSVEDTFKVEISWGDGAHSIVDRPASASGTQTFASSHRYHDDDPSGTPTGAYTVTVTVTDADSGTAETDTTVTVANLAPSVSVTGAAIDENEVATISVTIDDPSVEDTFKVEISWGDGAHSIVDRPASASRTQTFASHHRYHDDDPSGTPTGAYTVTVTVTDDDTGTAETTTTVTVTNLAPSVSASGAAVDENEVATLSVTIDDRGVTDTFDVEISWGDGTSDTFALGISGDGSQTFERSHRYHDDDPSGTPADDYTVTVTVTDDDTGTAATDAVVSVANLAPTASIDAVGQGGNLVGNGPTAEVDQVLAGIPVDLEASFSDVGTLDTHEVVVSWGDGDQDGGPATGQLARTHTYGSPGEYTLTVTVIDDDTGEVEVSQPLRVVDAAGAVTDAVDGLKDVADDPTTDPVAAELIGEVLAELVGNNGGADSNGALDKLEKGEWNAALVKLAKAVAKLEQADDLADIDLSVAVARLVFSAKAVVVDQYERAAADATPNELGMLAAAEALIRDGDAFWALGDGAGAIATYRKALNALPG